MLITYVHLLGRAHANGSIRRGHKNDATDTVTMRTGLGINLKEVKIFNRVREKGQHSYNNCILTYSVVYYISKMQTHIYEIKVMDLKYIASKPQILFYI